MIPGVALYTIGTAGIVDSGNRWLYLGIAAVLLVLVLFLGWYIRRKHLGAEMEEENASAEGSEEIGGEL